jgi:hypothetical protein
MQFYKFPLLMGGMMGLMLPWMMHMENGGSTGLAFVFAHLALVAGMAFLALFIPTVRRKLHTLKKHISHFPLMGIGLVSGWVATCAFCLAIGGVHWT